MLTAFSAFSAIFLSRGRGLKELSVLDSAELLIATTAYSSPRLIFLAFSSAMNMQATVDETLMQIMTVIIYALNNFILCIPPSAMQAHRRASDPNSRLLQECWPRSPFR